MDNVMKSSETQVLDRFLSDEECRVFVARSESAGYEDSFIISGGKPILAREIRNNKRVIIDDPDLAQDMWLRLKSQLTLTIQGWQPVGLNERFRFYRYEPRQLFRLHKDFPYESGALRSFLSLIIYLNDGFEGGETDFRDFKIPPQTGRAAIFKHELLHEGCAVLSGTKYAVRTDVMFRRNP
ncbi:2OG-Fe(II) superfamily oxygenase [Oleiphilus messinensis]|uniref:2OG-Fe(II) superfamily oxygenase n=1 Tax=Oleiphilus messinensis TaxID=141451 RepID=A0A1Y0IBM9_9GAMM|nr:2OG-Fe(II) oxygenase [Oleiphilus messinensis]ARU56783.1 2OG-Fe(II) superfamily oxygenase [Oleiphilus messinensis]